MFSSWYLTKEQVLQGWVTKNGWRNACSDQAPSNGTMWGEEKPSVTLRAPRWTNSTEHGGWVRIKPQNVEVGIENVKSNSCAVQNLQEITQIYDTEGE